MPSASHSHHPDPPRPTKTARPPQLLRTGTYMHTCCPECHQDLIEGDWIRLQITGPSDERGQLRLSPRFNIFDKEATIRLDPGTKMSDLSCPHCRASLLVPGLRCGSCGSQAARIYISAVELEVELYICTRVGCRWHGLAPGDQRRLILDGGHT